MKKFFVMLAAVAVTFGAVAQTNTTAAQMKREWRQMVHQRDYSKNHLESGIPVSTEAENTPKGIKSLPSDRVWFPGEWEEVQAIVVTCLYDHYPAEHPNNMYWQAIPMLSGYAQYYHYANGWQQQGSGPYVSVPDTTANDDFVNVFYYLMDAIQQGGAEAWVRVENESDSSIIKRKLTRMGLRSDNMRFLKGTGNSFWYRDCGPICFYYGDQDSVAMLDFTYYPGRALDDSLPTIIHRQTGLPNYMTKVEWEGGNCLVDGAGMVISSDAIYENNYDGKGQITWDGHNANTIHYTQDLHLNQAQVRQALHDLLGQRATYVIPAYQYDGGTGHIDLYADMYDENGFVFSVMPSRYSSWYDYRVGQQNMANLCSYKTVFDRDYYTMATLPFPSTDNGGYFSSQTQYDNNYTRTYSNHTFVNNLIMQPCFSTVGADGMPTAAWDKANVEKIKEAYPGYTIYCVDVREFDGSGGAIHCITKQIPAENPVRILHKNIHGNANVMQGSEMPVSAIITNKSGIAHAEVVYRLNGGEWQTLNLTANDNRFHGKLPSVTVPEITVDDTVVNTVPVYNVTDSTIASIDTIYGVDSVMTIDTTYSYVYDTVMVYDTVINTTHVDSLVNVEYYISATSNNGKTITKPMTASQGGYYSFFYTNTVDTTAVLDSNQYDFDTLPMPMENITFVFGSSWATEEVLEGIEEVNVEERFGQFYPNPATDQANMWIDMGIGGQYKVTVFDAAGRTVHTTSMLAAGQVLYTVNTAMLNSGLYTVVFENGSSRVARKLIVK